MAKSGEKTVQVTQWDTLKFAWSVTGQNVAENTSTIEWSMTLISGSSGRIDSTADKSWSVTIDGKTYKGTNKIGIANNSTLKLAGGTVKLNHDASGSKTFNYSFSQTFDIVFGGNRINTISGSGSGTIDVIVQATVPKINKTSADMGTEITITAENKNTSVVHDLAYKFGDNDWVKIVDNVKGAHKWIIPLSLAEIIPHKTSGTVSIRCVSKIDNKTIGQNIVTLTVNVPASVVPVISAINVTEASEGMPNLNGKFVQTISALQVEIIAEGAYGSTIKTYSSIFETRVYNKSSWTSDLIRNNGKLDLVVTVTDTRGRKTEQTVVIDVLAYDFPHIHSFKAERCTIDGVTSETGEYVKISYLYNCSKLDDKMTAMAEIKIKESSTPGYMQPAVYTDTKISSEVKEMIIKKVNTNGEGSTGSTGSTSGSDGDNVDNDEYLKFDTETSYDIRLSVKDLFGHETFSSVTVLSDSVIIDISSDGKGIAFFEFCENEGVKIGKSLPSSPGIVLDGTDLNSLTEPGFYVVPNASVSGTLVNRPSNYDAPASIVVLPETMDSGISIRQIFRSTSAAINLKRRDLKIWERSYKSNPSPTDEEWGPWICVYAGHGNILWTGNEVMGEDSEISLSGLVSEQPNGICMVFSHHAGNFFYNSFFIPKAVIDGTLTGQSTRANCSFTLASDGIFTTIGSKRLNIDNNSISGMATNSASGTAPTGIKYDNQLFSLRFVIGV